MAKTETATAVSITVNGEKIKLRAKDALVFAWHVTLAAECAVEADGEACVVLDSLPNGDMRVHGSALQEVVGLRGK